MPQLGVNKVLDAFGGVAASGALFTPRTAFLRARLASRARADGAGAEPGSSRGNASWAPPGPFPDARKSRAIKEERHWRCTHARGPSFLPRLRSALAAPRRARRERARRAGRF